MSGPRAMPVPRPHRQEHIDLPNTTMSACRQIKRVLGVGVGGRKYRGELGGKLIERIALHQSGIAQVQEDRLGRISVAQAGVEARYSRCLNQSLAPTSCRR